MISMLRLKGKTVMAGRFSDALPMLFAAITAAFFFGASTVLIGHVDGAGVQALWLRLGLNAAVLLCAALILTPLKIGSEAWFYFAAAGKKATGLQVAFWFKPEKALRSLALKAGVAVRRLAWAAVFFTPGLAVTGAAVYMLTAGDISIRLLTAATVSGTVIFAIGAVFYLLMIQRYFLAESILAADPRLKASQAIRQSIVAMEGSCARTLAFKLSFAPWFILCLAVFPILYVWPYYRQTCSCLRYELQFVKNQVSLTDA